jgi:hypothetical protein
MVLGGGGGSPAQPGAGDDSTVTAHVTEDTASRTGGTEVLEDPGGDQSQGSGQQEGTEPPIEPQRDSAAVDPAGPVLDIAAVQSELDRILDEVVLEASTSQDIHDTALAIYENRDVPAELRGQAAYVVGTWYNNVGRTGRICDWYSRARSLAPNQTMYSNAYSAFCQ